MQRTDLCSAPTQKQGHEVALASTRQLDTPPVWRLLSAISCGVKSGVKASGGKPSELNVLRINNRPVCLVGHTIGDVAMVDAIVEILRMRLSDEEVNPSVPLLQNFMYPLEYARPPSGGSDAGIRARSRFHPSHRW